MAKSKMPGDLVNWAKAPQTPAQKYFFSVKKKSEAKMAAINNGSGEPTDLTVSHRAGKIAKAMVAKRAVFGLTNLENNRWKK